ncbi:MAG: hypothetical protein UW27_C0002G0106 [Parcubacteria group bacterium GW2011_GWA1_44_13]|uniref:Uncharacterized protein n=1 Tax=Candidatus Nomurabacteria bacterium GW2011_GWB1_44_12 TaxID=1618748 RepID=A0A837IAL1_9BACT|nr:MAG: hypothetical protein UW17_C0013G0009 [Candidatus Nomurabacteria bacterium GW2011_GWD1_44_10]KKT37161.1 MAG: hypothetical protein UW25_C0002G0107 [Candidatus Nomurabacteria bacterium GW2011_GWB1_44_12]KKT38456.1 MAG: hypothetical protein UW27_C0002G0106 [Parcubacteria group bacterium GW2011_GWA1_44_13]KKT60665.1 MAG: hypothetical protein UW54_C0006G0006 [Parcubacteria group bacterium GW2011_GWC1_44_26]
MPHHREGIQNELNKAYDEGHEMNEAIDVAEVTKEERGHIDDKEMRGELSLQETVALLKDKGYLDASFEGKEVHELAMRALSKEDALAEYKKSGDKAGAWDEFENMPYTIPKAENLDVMIMKFNKDVYGDDALAVMGALGVRPLTSEELIQYSIANPSHQEKKALVARVSNPSLDGNPKALYLSAVLDGRSQRTKPWGGVWVEWTRFPVVRK